MIRFIILIVILVLALSYFGISIRHIIQSPTGQDNFSFVTDLINNGWHLIVSWIAGLITAAKHVFG